MNLALLALSSLLVLTVTGVDIEQDETDTDELVRRQAGPPVRPPTPAYWCRKLFHVYNGKSIQYGDCIKGDYKCFKARCLSEGHGTWKKWMDEKKKYGDEEETDELVRRQAGAPVPKPKPAYWCRMLFHIYNDKAIQYGDCIRGDYKCFKARCLNEGHGTWENWMDEKKKYGDEEETDELVRRQAGAPVRPPTPAYWCRQLFHKYNKKATFKYGDCTKGDYKCFKARCLSEGHGTVEEWKKH